MIKKLLSFFSRDSASVAEGGLYSTQDKGGIRIVKVLKVDRIGVHVRLYSNRYSEHPAEVDPASLYMANIKNEPGNPGVGHMPIRRDAFLSWSGRLIKVVPVTEEELEGYRVWEEAKGGYFT